MTSWRVLSSGVLILIAFASARGQNYVLSETPQSGACFQIQLDMKLTGTIRVRNGDAWVSLPLRATATHAFPERVLEVGPQGLPQRTARHYTTAQASITRGNDHSERTLRDERRLVIVDHSREPFLVYSPSGPLTRQELELTSEHFDTLSVLGLLPGKGVAVGDTWKISNAVAQALCALEGLTAQDLSAKLVKVDNQVAQIAITGSVNGIDMGALVKLTVDATASFDLSQKHLTALTWKQKDERDQGPTSPASNLEATTTLERTAMELPTKLSDVALISVPDRGADVPAAMVLLTYHDPKDRFDLTYNRGWQVVGQTDEHLVLRLMDNGDLVAQATITPWPNAKAGSHVTPDVFRQQMESTPGWEDQSEQPDGGSARSDDNGNWIYHFSALGRMDGILVMQIFYLIASADGQQTVVAITMNQNQAEKLGSRDVTLVGGLHYPSTKAP